jgi:hypothetical protein
MDSIEQGPFADFERDGIAFDPTSLPDPEHQIHSIDDNRLAPNDLPQKNRLLSKREVNRRLKSLTAGIGHIDQPFCNQQAFERILHKNFLFFRGFSYFFRDFSYCSILFWKLETRNCSIGYNWLQSLRLT